MIGGTNVTGLIQISLPAYTGNALPLPGVLLLGWEAAPAIFMLWVDTLLRNVQFVATLAAVARWSNLRSRSGVLSSELARSPATWFGTVMARIAAVVLVPVLVVQLAPHYPEGLLGALTAARGLYPLLVLDVAACVYVAAQAVSAARGQDQGRSIRTSATERYILLYNRCVILELIAWISLWMGHAGTVIFLVLASAFISYVDTRENWLKDFEAKIHRKPPS